jgi:hypothetical protein
MNIDNEIKTYFIPLFCKWNFQDCIFFAELPTLPFSRFLVIDHSVVLKLMYHCPNRWSFVKADQKFKVDSSEPLTFITNTDITPLLVCIYNIRQQWKIEDIKNENLPFVK